MKYDKSNKAYESLEADLTARYGKIQEKISRTIWRLGNGVTLLLAFNADMTFEKKGSYWFSLFPTNHDILQNANKNGAYLVLICGDRAGFYLPFAKVQELLDRQPPDRKDGAWNLYIWFENDSPYFAVVNKQNRLKLDESHRLPIVFQPSEGDAENSRDDVSYATNALPLPERRLCLTNSVIRDREPVESIKKIYGYCCQICGLSIQVPDSIAYCEVHHVKPLGGEHGGPDHKSNMLVLCPNHHAMMDLGVIAIDPLSLRILTFDSHEPNRGHQLNLKPEHRLNQDYLKYHMTRYVGAS